MYLQSSYVFTSSSRALPMITFTESAWNGLEQRWHVASEARFSGRPCLFPQVCLQEQGQLIMLHHQRGYWCRYQMSPGARGLQQHTTVTRPNLKHGSRSQTHTWIRGWMWIDVPMKLMDGACQLRWKLCSPRSMWAYFRIFACKWAPSIKECYTSMIAIMKIHFTSLQWFSGPCLKLYIKFLILTKIC